MNEELNPEVVPAETQDVVVEGTNITPAGAVAIGFGLGVTATLGVLYLKYRKDLKDAATRAQAEAEESAEAE